MIVLSDYDIANLLHAVPSFQERWRKTEASDAKYAADFPEDAQTPPERTDAFLGDLAYHLGHSVSKGELHEIEWLAAALETIYSRLSETDAAKLTISFMESLVYGIDHAGGDPSTVTHLMTGAHTQWRWRQAFAYTRGTYLYDQEADEPDRGGEGR